MKATTRARMLWVLGALTAAYTLATILVFMTAGVFGTPWFVASLIVYGILFLASAAFAATDSVPVSAPVPVATPVIQPVPVYLTIRSPQPKPVMPQVEQGIVYRTKTGQVLRTETSVLGARRTDHFVLTPGQGNRLESIEDHLDNTTPVVPTPSDAEIERALRRRSDRGQPLQAKPAAKPAGKNEAAPSQNGTKKVEPVAAKPKWIQPTT